MFQLNLREEYQAAYKEAVKNNQATITAAPFFSLKTTGAEGCIVGKAIYEGKVKLEEII